MDLVVCLLFGLAIGSFLNVCIARLPLGESVVHPRSRCPQCRKLIAWYDNFPVLSYAILGGRCRNCRKTISAVYPGIELLTAAISVLLYFKFGLSIEWGVFFVFSAAVVTLAFIDIDHRILPDVITLNGIWIGIVVNVALATPSPFISNLLSRTGFDGLNPRWIAFLASLAGIVIGGGLLWLVAEAYFRIRGVEGMGFGDVKMMAMVGAFLGAPLALLTIMIGSVFGAIVGLALIRFGGKHRDYELPFGTFLSLAGVIAVLYGDALIHWYFVHMIQPAL
jgi:leader peptidase (prepilin peptidase) / N-methyltransferase